MTISVFSLFSSGIGPSSSHTVGPMKAAHEFIHSVKRMGRLYDVQRIIIDLYGSLALTGKGHSTDVAILNGLENQWPKTVDPDTIHPRAQKIIREKKTHLDGMH